MKRTANGVFAAALLVALAAFGTLGARAQDGAKAATPARAAGKGGAPAAFHEIFDQSQKGKKGLTLHVNGQTIAGIVTKVGDDTVEVRNQTHDRIAIRLDRIDAVAVN